MALHETIQDFPAGVCMGDVTLSPSDNVAVREGEFSLRQQITVFQGQRWQLEVDFLPMERDEAAILEPWLLSLRGAAGTFRMGDPYRSLPRGSSLGTPLVAEAEAGSEQLISKGWEPSESGVLLANDLIQIDDHLYTTLRDVTTDSEGVATLFLWPALRESYSEDQPIITQNARGVFRLVDPVNFSRNQVELYGTRLRAVEVVASSIPSGALLSDSGRPLTSDFGSILTF